MGGWVERKVLKEVCERWKTPKSKKEEEDDETRFLVCRKPALFLVAVACAVIVKIRC